MSKSNKNPDENAGTPPKTPGRRIRRPRPSPANHEDVKAHDAAIDSPNRKRLPPLLRQAWYSLNQAFRRRISHLDVTPDQFTILRWLVECDPDWPTQRELGDMMASDPNTITSLVRRMAKAEIIERWQDDKDRRANRIRITAPGKKIYNKARRIAIDLQSEVLQALPANERDSFFDQLETVANACRDTLDEKP